MNFITMQGVLVSKVKLIYVGNDSNSKSLTQVQDGNEDLNNNENEDLNDN